MLSLITLNLSQYAFSQEIKATKNIEVNSDNFNMNLKENIMVFSNNVDIKLENFHAKCNKSIVYLNSKKKKIEKIIMIGKVKIQKDNSEINGEKVIFEPENDKITVEGNVKTKVSF